MNEYKIIINGNEYMVAIKDTDDEKAVVTVNGAEYNVELEKKIKKKAVQKVEQPTVSVNSAPVKKPVARPTSGGSGVTAPLPGVLLDVYVKEGDAVKAGQKVVLLEAMKMENVISSDVDGVVSKVNFNKGDSVLEGSVLIEMA
ncbi:MAG: biotin/lipoyl-binding protein [Bacteroidetes bacterium]|nr:biotin/lipoyl-binding protein [Bacteroidota bacterium]